MQGHQTIGNAPKNDFPSEVAIVDHNAAAIKCPDVLYHIVGAKTIQQALLCFVNFVTQTEKKTFFHSVLQHCMP